jgi:Phosphodiester glycosidase
VRGSVQAGSGAGYAGSRRLRRQIVGSTVGTADWWLAPAERFTAKTAQPLCLGASLSWRLSVWARQMFMSCRRSAGTLPDVKRLHVLQRTGLRRTGRRRTGLRPVGCLLTLGLSLLGAASVAGARPVIIGGVPTSPVIETKPLSHDREGLPVWFLPRLGVQTRNDPQDLWLSTGTRSLRYTSQAGWQASGFTLSRPLPLPERYGEGGSLHVTLEVLRALGLGLSGSADALKVTARRVAVEVPEVPTPQLSVAARAPAAARPAAARPAAARPAANRAVANRPAATQPTAQPATRPPIRQTPPGKAAANTLNGPEPVRSEGQQPLPPTPTASTAATALPGGAVLTPPRRTSTAATSQAHSAQTRLAQTSSTQTSSTQTNPTQTNPTRSSTPPAQGRPAQTSPAAARPAQSAAVQAPRTQPTLLAQTNPEPEGPLPVQPLPVQPVPNPAPVPTPAPPTPPTLNGPRITGVRSSLSSVRSVQLQRLVIDLSGPGSYSAQNERGGVTVFLPGATTTPGVQTLESGDTLTLAPDTRGVTVRLDANGGQSQVSTLDNPDRLVIDTATGLSGDVPPPINEDALPGGVTLRTFGGLSLLSFDPARYAPRVATAPSGSALSVAELVRRFGGVAGINGGYFDPPSGLPVDFVAANGRLLAASLERRGTVGFGENGEPLFGFPRPRYTLSGSFGSLNVNTVTSRALPHLLTAFVGDGHTAVGGDGLTTLTLNTAASSVLRADSGGTVPAAGLISLSFDPARFSQLPRTPGSELSATLNYQSAPWQGIREGLSAGPMLIQDGLVVLNPEREAFNVLSGVWRPTRQVAFAIYKGQPTLAFLEFGTPDTFAHALHSAGVQHALRLDSGSSATVFVTGGYLGTGGYLNSVWSRPVPNAIVLVPVDGAGAVKANKGK